MRHGSATSVVLALATIETQLTVAGAEWFAGSAEPLARASGLYSHLSTDPRHSG